ncbi:cutinase [Cadophora sp. MPI-SDFR-AT-0126]|nr:cutinase [Leotiomycetes sp. MPI-SDFR-AT-0126]
MHSLASLLTTLPLAIASQMIAHASAQEPGTSTCTDTYIFFARGWNEDYPGRQSVLDEALSTALYHSPTSSSYEDILYHSSFDANYCDSISEGVANGQAQLIAYNKRCPKSKLVVSGYSQGAYVVGDMFAGGGGTFGDCVQTSNDPFDIESDAGKMVTAILLWGSKRHTASQPYNTFSGAEKNGTYPRPVAELDALKKWTPILRDYCVNTDPNCAGGKVNEDHWNYFELYSDEAAEWVKNQVENDITVTNITVASVVAQSNNTATSSVVSSSTTQSSTSISKSSVMIGTSTSLPISSTTSSSAAATSSSSGSAAPSLYQVNMIGLAITGSFAAYI